MADQIRRTERLQTSSITRSRPNEDLDDEEREKQRIMMTLQGIVEAAMRERRRNRLF